MTQFDWHKPLRLRFISALVLLAAVGCSAMDHSGHGQSGDGPVSDAPGTAADVASEMDHSEMDHSAPAPSGAAANDDHGHGDHGHEDHGHEDHGHEDHHHPPLVVPADQPAPALTLAVTPDPVSGWNLELQTTNFEFAPERVNGDSIFNEGHAHLFVNGEKRGRIYSNWHHLTDLPSGENTIQVTLNSNGHEELVVAGEVVADTVVVNVP